MNIRIYQVNMSRDVNNVGFASYENLEKWQGTSAIDSSIYDKVFSGEVKCKTLEDVYVKFNQHHPRGYKLCHRFVGVRDFHFLRIFTNRNEQNFYLFALR